MGAFQYVAVDTAGQERQGILEGDSVKQIRQMLREQSLLPVSVEEIQRKEAVSSQVSRFSSKRTRSMSAHELALVTRQLSTLVRAGLPLEESLLAVSEQTEQAHVRSVFMGVRAKVLEGHPLADGFGDFPRSFPDIYTRFWNVLPITQKRGNSCAVAPSTQCYIPYCCSPCAPAS